tara:strand:+ start:51 stop:557 length:507 start_codon:yes stop_codon:yes gene_type:complete
MAKKITKQQIVDYWETRKYEGNIGTDWDTAAETCWCCSRFTKSLEKAHIVPDMLGGEYEVSNLVLLCSTCHREAPDFDNPDYMWDWLKAHSEAFHEKFILKRTMEEYEKMFGKLPSVPADEQELFYDTYIKSIDKSGYHGGTTSYSTRACILKETFDVMGINKGNENG